MLVFSRVKRFTLGNAPGTFTVSESPGAPVGPCKARFHRPEVGGLTIERGRGGAPSPVKPNVQRPWRTGFSNPRIFCGPRDRSAAGCGRRQPLGGGLGARRVLLYVTTWSGARSGGTLGPEGATISTPSAGAADKGGVHSGHHCLARLLHDAFGLVVPDGGVALVIDRRPALNLGEPSP